MSNAPGSIVARREQQIVLQRKHFVFRTNNIFIIWTHIATREVKFVKVPAGKTVSGGVTKLL